MATLVIKHPSREEVYQPLFKNLTSLGSDKGSDVFLAGEQIPPLAAHIHRIGSQHHITILWKDMVLNEQAALRAQLKTGDVLGMGGYQLYFHEEDLKPSTKLREREVLEMAAYKKLLHFSERLAERKDVQSLLEALMDEIIHLTRAEKGFLLFWEKDQLHLKVARLMGGETSSTQEEPLSDSILQKVIQTQKPLVISNANEHPEFQASVSVVNYRLTSVMCAPLMYQGELLGVIYLGNNSFINVFDETSLTVLSIFASQAAMLVKQALHLQDAKTEAAEAKKTLETAKFGGIIGACIGMQNLFRKVEKVAKTDVSILIIGETGTGKELIARELHNRSNRAQYPFIVVNCAAIPEHLLESELFGHVKGAFTGAFQSRIGRFQAAHRGTIFLDEIGEMPLHLQAKILRVLQERCITRVGDTKAEEVDIRVLSATNRNLHQMVHEKTFREDLYYRLNVMQINLPPLRERGNDVLVLANYFVQKYAKFYNRSVVGFTEKAQNILLNFTWPGNIRQLENRIRRAIVMSENNYISPEDLDITQEHIDCILTLSEAVERFRKRYVQESLERNAGNRTKTAKELGVDPRTIFRHLEDMKGEGMNA